MLASVLVATAMFAQDPQPVTRTVTVQGPKIEFPDEFLPAAATYFACRVASEGGTIRNGPNGTPFNPDNIQLGEDCSKIRERETARAMEMLSDSDLSEVKRREFVEQTFDQIDAFVTQKPGPAPGGKQ